MGPHTWNTETRWQIVDMANSIERLVPKNDSVSVSCECAFRSLVKLTEHNCLWFAFNRIIIIILYRYLLFLICIWCPPIFRMHCRQLLNHDAWLRVHIFIMDVSVKMTLCNRPATCPPSTAPWCRSMHVWAQKGDTNYLRRLWQCRSYLHNFTYRVYLSC